MSALLQAPWLGLGADAAAAVKGFLVLLPRWRPRNSCGHAGGYVHFRETAGGVETQVELREDGRGGVTRTCRVAGAVRAWDADAQRWYERINQHLCDHLK